MTKIENEQIIDLSGINVEIKQLTCNICYCLLINPKKCSNKKCSKMFCSECIDTAIQNEPCCPFCRLTIKDVDFVMCEANLNFVLYNLKVFCNHFECEVKPYKISAYSTHMKNKNEENKCFKCQSTNKKEMKRCYNPRCKKLCCSDCNLISYCKLCMKNLCNVCGDINKHNKIVDKKSNSNYVNKVHFTCTEIFETEGELTKCNICKKFHQDKKDTKSCLKCNERICLNFPCDKYNNLCEDCISKVKSEENQEICFRELILDCSKCFPKCCFKNVLGVNECSKCAKMSCESSFCTSNCQVCKKTFCNECFVMCKLCKTETCKDCCVYCEECKFSHDNSFCCLKCSKTIGNSLIKRCSYTSDTDRMTLQTISQCESQLCLNCWKVCNACSAILCSQHANKCSGCENNSCKLHLYHCEFCEIIGGENEKTANVCSKKCARKCELCNNISTSHCNKEIHPFVYEMNCGHNICVKCGKKCGKCGNAKNNFGEYGCSICCNSKFIYCKFCKLEYCQMCSYFCGYCGQYFCPYNKCVNCNEQVKKCVNCLLMDAQVYCGECNQTFDVCDLCSDFLICSEFCYVEFSKKKSHLCTMFNCEKCMKYKLENKLVKKRGSISCEIIIKKGVKPLMSMSDSESFNRFDDSEGFDTPRRRRNTTEDDKVVTGCQDSCACIIY